jgi:acyl-CoA hydrolase
MRRSTLEVKVLSSHPLSSLLDSIKDAYFVCVASHCQGRPYWTGRMLCSRLKIVPLRNC